MNPLKPTTTFKAGDVTYKLSYSAEALYRLEKQLGMGTKAIGALMDNEDRFSMDVIRTVFWAGLLDEQTPEIELSDIGKIMKHLGPIEAIKITTAAFLAAFIDPDQKKGAPPDPPAPGQAESGTGSDS